MTQPPDGPEQDRPQDVPRSFPTYGRPEQPRAQQAGTPWAAPGQPQPQPGQPPYGQPGGQPPNGQQPGEPPYGQQPGGPTPYGQAPYGAGYGPGQYPGAYGQAPASYGYGYGYPGQMGGGTNGLAVAALATGLGGILFGLAAPVAICLGIAALVQLRKRDDSGKGMAIAGLVIGSLVTVGWVLFFGMMIAFAGSSDGDYGSPEPVSSYSGPTTYVDELAVGECYDDGNEDGEAIRQPCNVEHDGEIIADVTLPEGPYPGDRGVDKAGDNACSAEFGKYVGKPIGKSELDLAWWAPTRSRWIDNNRMVVCAAYGPDGDKLTGTVKNSKR